MRFGAIWLLINLALNFIGQSDNNQRRSVHCRLDIAGLKAMFLGEFEIVRAGQFRYSNTDTAVAEVLRVGMSLTAVADDGHFFAF